MMEAIPMTLRSTGQIGHDIRALRQSRDWTLIDLANELDRSIGWLSQVGVGRPSRPYQIFVKSPCCF